MCVQGRPAVALPLADTPWIYRRFVEQYTPTDIYAFGNTNKTHTLSAGATHTLATTHEWRTRVL